MSSLLTRLTKHFTFKKVTAFGFLASVLFAFLAPFTLTLNRFSPELQINQSYAQVSTSAMCKQVYEDAGTILGGGAESIGCFIIAGLVRDVFWNITQAIAIVAARFLDFFIWFSLQNEIYRSGSFIQVGWGAVRDLSNLILITGLIMIAAQLILGLGLKKKLLANILVGALLINFTPFFVNAVISVSNWIALTLYNQINVEVSEEQAGDEGETLGTAGSTVGADAEFAQSGTEFREVTFGLMTKIDPQKIVFSGAAATGISLTQYVVAYAALGIVNIILIGIFFKSAFLFLGRVVELLMRSILAPIAMASLAMPAIRKQKFLGYDDWFNGVLKSAFMAPLFIFFLYLAVLFVEVGSYSELGNFTGSSGFTSLIGSIISVLIPLGLISMILIQGLKVAQSTAGSIAQMSGDAFQKAFTTGTAVVGGLALGGAALAGRKTLGGLAKKAVEAGEDKSNTGFLARLGRGEVKSSVRIPFTKKTFGINKKLVEGAADSNFRFMNSENNGLARALNSTVGSMVASQTGLSLGGDPVTKFLRETAGSGHGYSSLLGRTFGTKANSSSIAASRDTAEAGANGIRNDVSAAERTVLDQHDKNRRELDKETAGISVNEKDAKNDFIQERRSQIEKEFMKKRADEGKTGDLTEDEKSRLSMAQGVEAQLAEKEWKEQSKETKKRKVGELKARRKKAILEEKASAAQKKKEEDKEEKRKADSASVAAKEYKTARNRIDKKQKRLDDLNKEIAKLESANDEEIKRLEQEAADPNISEADKRAKNDRIKQLKKEQDEKKAKNANKIEKRRERLDKLENDIREEEKEMVKKKDLLKNSYGRKDEDFESDEKVEELIQELKEKANDTRKKYETSNQKFKDAVKEHQKLEELAFAQQLIEMGYFGTDGKPLAIKTNTDKKTGLKVIDIKATLETAIKEQKLSLDGVENNDGNVTGLEEYLAEGRGLSALKSNKNNQNLQDTIASYASYSSDADRYKKMEERMTAGARSSA